MRFVMGQLWCIQAGDYDVIPAKDTPVFTGDEIDDAVAQANAERHPAEPGGRFKEWSKIRLDDAMSGFASTAADAVYGSFRDFA